MLNPEITANLAECDEIHALGDPGNWMRMYGPIPAIRLFDAYPALRQHIAAQAARIAELEQGINSANTAAAHHYEKLTANNEVYRVELNRLKRGLAAAEERITILRYALCQTIRNVGGVAAHDVSDEFLLLAPAEAGAVHYARNKLTEINSSLASQLAASQAQNAVLRAALEHATDAAKSYRSDILGHSSKKMGPYYPECFHSPKWPERDASIRMAESALAATPAASLASVKAGTLREFADEIFRELDKNGNPAMMAFEVSLRERADQLEAAAKGERG